MAVAVYIERHPGSPTTAKQHLAAIRSLFDYLVTGHVIAWNPASSVRGPRQQMAKGKTPAMTAEEVRALLTTCDPCTLIGLRDKALFAIMLYSFARVGAVTATLVGEYYQRGRRSWLRLHEKGGRFLEAPLHAEADEALAAYLTRAGIGADKKALLFQALAGHPPALSGRAMSRRVVLLRVKQAAAVAGLTERICNHSFRATGITLYRKAGGPLDKARVLVGHASTRTTQLYDRSDDEVNANEVDRIVV